MYCRVPMFSAREIAYFLAPCHNFHARWYIFPSQMLFLLRKAIPRIVYFFSALYLLNSHSIKRPKFINYFLNNFLSFFFRIFFCFIFLLLISGFQKNKKKKAWNFCTYQLYSPKYRFSYSNVFMFRVTFFY